MGEGFPPIYCPYCGHYPVDITMEKCKGCKHSIELIIGYMGGFIHERLFKPEWKAGGGADLTGSNEGADEEEGS